MSHNGLVIGVTEILLRNAIWEWFLKTENFDLKNKIPLKMNLIQVEES